MCVWHSVSGEKRVSGKCVVRISEEKSCATHRELCESDSRRRRRRKSVEERKREEEEEGGSHKQCVETSKGTSKGGFEWSKISERRDRVDRARDEKKKIRHEISSRSIRSNDLNGRKSRYDWLQQ